MRLRQVVLPYLQARTVVADPAAARSARHPQIEASRLTISVIVPVYNTPERYLKQCLASVQAQTYPHWEMILVDDASTAAHVRPLLTEAAARDARIKTVFRDENGHISAALNSGLAVATGAYFTVLDHDDLLHPGALYWIVDTLIEAPDAEYIYSDEDKTDDSGTRFFDPFLKPGWSPELVLQCMYTCHMSVYHREKAQTIGGFRSAFDGAQDYDFMLRFIATHDRIHHVNKVLYHWRIWEQSTALSLEAKPYALDRQRKAIREYLEAQKDVYTLTDHVIGGHHKVSFQPRRPDLVSIIIPTANKSIEIDGRTEHHAEAVVQSIIARTTYDRFEILLMHDGNLSAAQQALFQGISPLRLVEYDNSDGFNYSEKVNLGAAEARGDYLLLMNDDTRVITPDWLERLLGMAQRPGVGAVGAKLIFPDGTLQHSGIWLRGNVPGHIDYGAAPDTHGYDLSGQSNRNCIAVTGACQLTPRKLFEAVGGYDTAFPLNYNDVDYCLRLHEQGHRSVCLNDVELCHHEGASRTGGQEVSAAEIERFLEMWSTRVPVDPYLPANLV